MVSNQDAVLIQNLQDQVQVLEDAAVAAAAAVPPEWAPPVLPVFTLVPSLANTAAPFLDLTSTSGEKHFKGATKSLTLCPFDFTDPSDLHIFLDLVLKKSQVYGWNPMLTVPVTNAATGMVTTHNLLKEYGVIPLASITTHVTTYYDTQTKQAQDSFMLCQCLLSSLSVEFIEVIAAETQDYHLPAIVGADGPIPCGPIPCGPLLLKIIISKALIGSRATEMFIRTSLSNLDNMMVELDSNIQEFNLYVESQVKSLAARGGTSEDLLINLFKGYKVANDSRFQEFIKRKENEYDEGHDVGVNNLMADAAAKYRACVLSKKWSVPTKEEGEIIALTAQVEQLKTKQPKKTPKKGKNPEWVWKDVMPKDGEPRTKDFKGKHYHLGCKFHPYRWVCHATEECSKNPDNVATAAFSSTLTRTDKGEKKAGLRRLKAANPAMPPPAPEERSGLVILQVAEVAQQQEHFLRAGELEGVKVAPIQFVFGTQILLKNSKLDDNLKIMIHEEIPKRKKKAAIKNAVSSMNQLQEIINYASSIQRDFEPDEMVLLADMFRTVRINLNQMYEYLPDEEKEKYHGYFVAVARYERKIAKDVYS